MKHLVVLFSSFFLLFSFPNYILAANSSTSKIHGVFVGMKEGDFAMLYPKETIRTSRQEGIDRWITVNDPKEGKAKRLITFYLMNGKVSSWSVDNRKEVMDEYLGEFCSLQGFPKIFTSIQDVLMRIPYKDFITVTNRERPVVFLEVYDSGTARFAGSQEFILTKDDAPCCREGFTIIKLGLGLDGASNPAAIKGVVAHELAHRVLDHIRKGYVNCDAERQANRLIKSWGFGKEFIEASHAFGQRKGDPVGCQEIKSQTSKAK